MAWDKTNVVNSHRFTHCFRDASPHKKGTLIKTTSRFLRYGALFYVLLPAVAQIGGPAILSRGGLQRGTGGSSDLFRIQPFARIDGVYQDGLTPPLLEDGTTIPNWSSTSVNATFGALGYHRWSRSLLGLGYQGGYRYNTRRQVRSLNGTSHSLVLGFTHQPTRRLSFSLTEVAGISPRAVNGISGLPLGRLGGFGLGQSLRDPNFNEVPEEDVIDTRTTFLSSGGDLTFQKSARLSFHAGATGFTIHRKASGLAGVTGFSTRGDVAYALDRNSTIGIDYGYVNYGFNRAFGSSNAHMLALDYSRGLGRRWNSSLRAGMYRLEFLSTQQVAIDPVIAAILGQRSATEVVYGITYGTIFGGTLNGNFQRYGVAFNYLRGIIPGNGIYLTSVVDRLSASYNYRGLRTWTFGAGAMLSQLGARTQQLPHFRRYGVHANVNRRLLDWLHFTSATGVRRSEVKGRFRRDSWFVSAGFGFSPGEVPVSFW